MRALYVFTLIYGAPFLTAASEIDLTPRQLDGLGEILVCALTYALVLDVAALIMEARK